MIDDQKLLSDLQNADANTRFAAWRAAGDASPAAIPAIGKLAASPTPGVAKAAREALTTMTHSVGKDPANPKRGGIVKGLLDIAAANGDLGVRAHALRLLSNLAGEDSVPAIARLFSVADLREEVVFSIERIPGAAADKALIAAYASVPDDFKPRILAALGHRRTADAANLTAEACASSNKEIAFAAIKAFSRIGKATNPLPRPLDASTLTPFQADEQYHGGLRYAEAQAAAGNSSEAARIYKYVLGLAPAHLQCAAILGLAKLGNQEAADAIMPKLKSENSRVRITAQNAWKSMATRA